jgi:hypothetical protein
VISPSISLLTRAASAIDDRPSAIPPTPSEPPLHKYIIVRDSFDGQSFSRERLIIFDRRLEHKAMVPIGCDPLSAGFFTMIEGRPVILEIPSTSLHIGPRPQDSQLLTHFLGL